MKKIYACQTCDQQHADFHSADYCHPPERYYVCEKCDEYFEHRAECEGHEEECDYKPAVGQIETRQTF